MLYTRQGLYAEAKVSLERACAIWEANRDIHGLMRGFINLSALYIKWEQPDKALEYLNKAYDYAEKMGDIVGKASIYGNMASVHQFTGNLEQAKALNFKAENIFQQYSHLAMLAHLWDNLGTLFTLEKAWAEADYYLSKGLDGWRSLGIKRGEIEVLLDFIAYELARTNYEQAAIRLKEVESLVDNIAGEVGYFRERIDKYHRSLG